MNRGKVPVGRKADAQENRSEASEYPLHKSTEGYPPVLKNALSQIDQDLIRKNKKLSSELFKVLAVASPKSAVDLISGLAVDLADFWEIGEEHRQRIRELRNMRFPRDRQRFENMLYDLQIRLVWHAEWHAKHLKRRLEQLKVDLKLKPRRRKRVSSHTC
jgi:hypothetical protein